MVNPSLLAVTGIALFGFAVVGAGCTAKNPEWCGEGTGCEAGMICADAHHCVPSPDGGVALDGDPPAEDSRVTDAVVADGPGGDQGPASDGPSGAPNGTACGQPSACQSGHCVDGVCCVAACDGACRSCKVAGKQGQCELVADGTDPDGDCQAKDSACAGACSGGACVFPGEEKSCKAQSCVAAQVTTYRCDGVGGCQASSESCGGYACDGTAGACKTSCTSTTTDCTGDFECVGKACSNPQPAGASCGTNDDACASGHCVDGVCCVKDSCGACSRCDLSGDGTCKAIADSAKQSCGAVTCAAGEISTPLCVGGACVPQTQSCGGYQCDGTSCRAACDSAVHCVVGWFCNGSKQCEAERALGAACTGGDQCGSGYCVNNACCSKSACAECNRCDLNGSGTCSAIADAAKQSCGAVSCAGGEVSTPLCVGGACVPQTQSCSGYECDGAACRTSCGSDLHCASGWYCNTSSSQCVAKLAAGAGCGTDDQCQSGECTDGACCNVADCGDCKACNLNGLGTCSAVANGPAPVGECPGDAPCNAGQCSGGSCAYYATGTTCQESCDGGTNNYVRKECTAQHLCQTAVQSSCSPYRCGATTCRTSCDAHSHCVSTSVCSRAQNLATGVGTCVNPSIVTFVPAGQTIGSYLAGANNRVLALQGSSYGPVTIDTGITVTIIGTNATTIDAGNTGLSGPSAVLVNHASANVGLEGLRLTRGVGGGLSSLVGGGLECEAGTARAVDCTFETNLGFGITSNSNMTVDRCLFRQNDFGGLIVLGAGNVLVRNSLFDGNGGGSLSHSAMTFHADATGSMTVLNNTVVNTVNGGPALSCGLPVTFHNTILWNNDGAEYDGSCTFVSSTVDPNSCSLDSAYKPTAAGCINSGTAVNYGPLDLAKTPRVKGGTVDRGAYEVQ